MLPRAPIYKVCIMPRSSHTPGTLTIDTVVMHEHAEGGCTRCALAGRHALVIGCVHCGCMLNALPEDSCSVRN
jgi:hypothetical protein